MGLSNQKINVLTIYGSKDHVMNKERFEEYQKNLPKENEVYVISGGNHLGFATCGKQAGDGKRTISHDQQIKETVNKITEMEK